MPKPKLATVSLAGCFGCHMSLLDIDERLVELIDLVDLDVSPLDDKKQFDGMVDVGLVEGGCADEHNVHVLRNFRAHCRVLVAVGACAITGGVPAMRNPVGLRECLEEAYVKGPTVEGGFIPSDPELPLLLDTVRPIHEVVKVDYYLQGCPPSADAIWAALRALLTGGEPVLPYSLFKYE
ncbi:NADP oxidoreductase [Zavarzinia sp.]|uniref:NADH-quinone oxidoreductase subunit B family protein n=1 Tax=Zavarzinia sp. TaxID=2027920 RepID=UPI003563BA61